MTSPATFKEENISVCEEYGGAGSGADVKSDLTHSIKSSEADTDSGDDAAPPASSDALVHEIRCGQLTGKLHMVRFICPGIHRRCVEYDGQFISPRQFTIKAEKDKQKDWKGSIRLGRYNLRTLMELKSLDFHDHANNCSLKCQSRNYIKNRKTEAEAAALESLSLLEPTAAAAAVMMDNFNSSIGGGGGDVHVHVGSGGGRKNSSAVLEDYVCQTVASLNGNALAPPPSSQAGSTTAAEESSSMRIEEFLARLPTTTNGPSSLLVPPSSRPSQNQSRRMSSPALQKLAHPLQQQSPPKPHQQVLDEISLAMALSATGGGGASNSANAPAVPNNNDIALTLVLQSMLMEHQQRNQHQSAPPQNNGGGLFNGLAFPIMDQQQQQHQIPAQRLNPANANGAGKVDVLGGDSIQGVMEKSPLLFWARMRDLGVLEELTKTLSTTVDQLKQLYVHGTGTHVTEEFAAQKLSALSSVLDLGPVYAEKIHSRYVQSTLESSLITKELQELQKKAEEQRRRSQVFDQIIRQSTKSQKAPPTNGDQPPQPKRAHLIN